MKPRLSNSLLTALIFAGFGLLWIYFTDYIFLKIAARNLNRYYFFQQWKGTFFVIISALLIFWVNRALNLKLDKAHRALKKNNEQLKAFYEKARAQEQALQNSNERFELISRATGDGIWEYNLADRTSYANESLKNLFGYEISELADNFTWWTSNLHPDDKLRVIARTEAALEGNESIWHDEYRFRTKSGEYKTVYDRGFIVRDAQGKPVKLIGAMQDITPQKKLQEELIREKVSRQNEIARATMLVQEAERKQLGEELHDNINQLLATTKLYLDHALHFPETNAELVRKSIDHIMVVIEEIRKLSRSLAPPSLGDIGLREALQDLMEQVSAPGSLRVTLDMEMLEESMFSRDKKIAVYRIVQEQLNNILKHAYATEVVITLVLKERRLVLRIADNGVGFDTSDIRSGLGLNNIRNRAELYGGSMEINSKPGSGSILEVNICTDDASS